MWRACGVCVPLYAWPLWRFAGRAGCLLMQAHDARLRDGVWLVGEMRWWGRLFCRWGPGLVGVCWLHFSAVSYPACRSASACGCGLCWGVVLGCGWLVGCVSGVPEGVAALQGRGVPVCWWLAWGGRPHCPGRGECVSGCPWGGGVCDGLGAAVGLCCPGWVGRRGSRCRFE